MAPKGSHGGALAEPVAQACCVIEHDLANLPEPWGIFGLSSSEHVRKITEQPGSSQTTAPHDHAVAARGSHHAQGILRFPDVAVAEHRNGHGLLELSDRLPACRPVVKLRCSA